MHKRLSTRARVVRWTKPLIFLACLLPLAGLALATISGDLGPNPIERITHATGDWTIRLLLVALAITPARRLVHWPELIRLRRMLGLFAFFYGCLHLATYVVLDHFFDWNAIGKDVLKRPYVTAGFTALMLMVPLAVTSTAGWVRRLGGSRWRMLHRLAYVSATLGVVHYWWLVKSDITGPATYAALLALLLGYRAVRAVKPPAVLPRAERSDRAVA